MGISFVCSNVVLMAMKIDFFLIYSICNVLNFLSLILLDWTLFFPFNIMYNNVHIIVYYQFLVIFFFRL